MNNGQLTPEQAESLLNILKNVDEGNETIMTDIFTRLWNVWPEHRDIINRVYTKEVGRPFRVYEERATRRGY